MDLDVVVNHPPVITPDVSPILKQDPVFVDIADGVVPQTFIAPVIDYDGDEVLFHRWILTAVLQSGANTEVQRTTLRSASTETSDEPELIAAVLGEEALLAAPNARVASPDVRLELSVDLIRQRFGFPESLVGNDKTHLLELYVSDRAFDGDIDSVEPERAPGEPRQIPARAAWVVTVISTEAE